MARAGSFIVVVDEGAKSNASPGSRKELPVAP